MNLCVRANFQMQTVGINLSPQTVGILPILRKTITLIAKNISPNPNNEVYVRNLACFARTCWVPRVGTRVGRKSQTLAHWSLQNIGGGPTRHLPFWRDLRNSSCLQTVEQQEKVKMTGNGYRSRERYSDQGGGDSWSTEDSRGQPKREISERVFRFWFDWMA